MVKTVGETILEEANDNIKVEDKGGSLDIYFMAEQVADSYFP